MGKKEEVEFVEDMDGGMTALSSSLWPILPLDDSNSDPDTMFTDPDDFFARSLCTASRDGYTTLDRGCYRKKPKLPFG